MKNMELTLSEFRLLENGEVEEILRDAEFDENTNVYSLLGSIQLSDKTFMEGAMFLDEDLNKVWDAVPYQDSDGNIEMRKLDDPIILSRTDTKLVAKMRFKKYLDDKIAMYNNLIQNFGQIDPQCYQDFLAGNFDTQQNKPVVEDATGESADSGDTESDGTTPVDTTPAS